LFRFPFLVTGKNHTEARHGRQKEGAERTEKTNQKLDTEKREKWGKM